jgi:hypothetical protein
MRRAHQDELMQLGREFFIHRMMRSEQQRQPSGGVRMVLVFNPANQGAGPDCEFAVALR